MLNYHIFFDTVFFSNDFKYALFFFGLKHYLEKIVIYFFAVRVIAGGNKGVRPHGFSAVYPFGFMCCCDQLAVVFICCFLQVLHMRLLSKIHLLLLYICANWVIGKQTTKPHEFLRLGNWYLYQIVLFLVWTEYHHLA